MKSFVKRNEDKGIKRKKLFLDRKKAIIRNELYVKIIRTTSKQDTTKGDKDYMCGFAGFVGEVENREEVLENMMNTIIHRGPDSEGKYVDEDAAPSHYITKTEVRYLYLMGKSTIIRN